MLKLGVLVSGRGSNLQALLDARARGELKAEVAVVISDKAGALALERARAAGVPAYHVDPRAYPDKAAYEQEICRLLKENGVELVVLAGYLRLVGPVLLAAYPERIINIHPSLLPAFPGLEAQRQAWEYGVKISGCTVHFVDEGLDSGPIILQAAVPVEEGDTAAELAARILAEEHKLLPRTVNLIAEGRVKIVGRRVQIELQDRKEAF
ncbi:MAG: phosphoribosylglycinamide formyltransferase [Bacillota bacterium]